ncbi:type III-A CRISPR-associated RAMP protein Csm5 [Syntrophomonas wolfei]|uniref:CRISPR system Cms protein Csm5 n=1 Tax=Syntrophomonas wolfei subsp. wolfei (strain DSM 2245B / Goettingen) TaxID=335541 RepID=Q0AW54_SYNWW|nr:type III-A CRISPR-associated RAMP protein Csm5 [Syntrophomonas wolfei]ABI69050.1 CRISPR-associated protein, Csm5 family [Syntrophomonas wolfei subsp. wolfei str. Goettingen G311]
MKFAHLERLNLTLRALAPVFIGSGEQLGKKEYIFDSPNALIYFPDFPRLVAFLKERSLLAEYEKFLSTPRLKDIRVFLEENGISAADYPSFVRYSIAAGEAAHIENFREVLTFIKDSKGYPYIPGSSLKGAIRTALATYLLKRGDWERDRRNIEGSDSSVPARKYLARESSTVEKKVFYQLDIRNPKDGKEISSPINDLMQGIRISDSAALSFENLTLTGKYDRKPDGTVNLLPIFRECLTPGSEAHLQLTLDLPMLARVGLNAGIIEEALHDFADEHYAHFEQYFAELPEDASVAAKEGVDIFLGGGVGYVSKTLTYNLFPQRENAVSLAAKILTKQFSPKHGHSKDASQYKVSPHILKTTMYAGEYYHMGKCELIITR